MTDLKWWQKAVFYEIWPRSFQDSNGDGISDFSGMTARLAYLQDLGIDAIWLAPHFPSPYFDCGYDVADYTDVGAEYGTLADFKRFLDEAHQRQMRVILDLVLNHTSNQHAWFQGSRSSRTSPKRDWYIWRDGKDGGPPNNWTSGFGGPAWEYDPQTGQYYYHMFLKEQPDLNWRNPEVKQAMFDAVRFWLDLGVDGFRLDAISTIYEHPDLPDRPVLPGQKDPAFTELQDALPEDQEKFWQRFALAFQYQGDQPGLHELMQELRRVIDEYPARMLIGEAEDLSYCGDGTNELHMVFNFALMRMKQPAPAHVRSNQAQRLAEMLPLVWPCNTFGNHDTPRLLSRYGDGVHDAEIARLVAALLLTLRGTPVLYYGEEIGMTDLILTDYSQVRDMQVRWQYTIDVEQLGNSPQKAAARAFRQTRDKIRTPMQWENAPQAGFCPPPAVPWLPVNPNYAEGINVAEQLQDPGSLLNFYRRLLYVRRAAPALIAGDYQPLHPQSADYLAFLRSSLADRQTCLVVINFSAKTLELAFDLPVTDLRVIFSSRQRAARTAAASAVQLAPFEVFIAEV